MNITERFLKYVSFDTASDEYSESCPSTAKQHLLADYVVNELREIGLTDAEKDENCYVYAHIPASEGYEGYPKIGFIAHFDTSPAVTGANVNPRIIVYDGKNADLIPDRYIGKEIIVTDGTTLLGADDKAGVCEIVSACEYLIKHPEVKHGKICVGFTPDEEIGRGADLFDLKKFEADFGYTVDGGEYFEFENETFNAAACTVNVKGLNVHPGSAKNIMKNASLMLTEFASMLPAEQTPSHTCGYEGFYHLCDMNGNESEAVAHYIIRDHDREKFEQRKSFVLTLGDYLNAKYGKGTFTLTVKDSYYNMKEIIDAHPDVSARAVEAMRKLGIEPLIRPIRGGTDGARLSFEGLPCPNLPTGGMNFHGINEAIPVSSLETVTDIIIEIAKA